MSTQRPNPEELFDRAIEAVRNESIDARAAAASRERVERRLRAELEPPNDVADVRSPAHGESGGSQAVAGAGAITHDHRIQGCAGFQGLIPAYLAAALVEPRRILFEDHTRECVPCRRALAEARRAGGRPAGGSAPGAVQRLVPRRRPAVVRVALAAAVAGLVATGAVLLSGRLGLYGPDASAHVRAIEGELQTLDGSAVEAVAAGDVLARGETVRTGSGSGAVLELADGSRVELAQRSQLTLARRSDGVVLDLERGALIVEAAEQRQGHLYVRTSDCTVSVVGTIFSVHHGVRGSRVSVLAGEVHVDRSRGVRGLRRAVLRPGDQLATNALLGRVALAEEIAWSRNAADYRERITALAALGREIDATLATGGRTSTALVDRAPASTVVWVGLPNVAAELAEAWELVERRVAENPALAEWWSGIVAGASGTDDGDGAATGEEGTETDGVTEGGGAADHVAAALDHLRRFGSHLGEEIGVALPFDGPAGRGGGLGEGEPGAPLVIAQVVVDGAGFDALVDEYIAQINTEMGGERLRRIDDPSQAGTSSESASDGDAVLYLWHAPDGLFAVSPSVARLAELAAGSSFAGTALHARLEEIYRAGTGWVVGVDAASILAGADEGVPDGAFAALGLAEAEHFLIESETVAGSTETRATLAFSGARRGAAAWLGAPAPSGALEFVSSSASFAVAGLSKDPVEMVDELLAAVQTTGGDGALDELARVESELGFSLRDDLAAAFGGDAAFALDGPLLPTPSWKLVVEVTNPSHFEFVLGRAIDAVNRAAAEEGRAGLRYGEEEAGGRRFLTVAAAEGATVAVMTFVDGYLVAGPSRALLLEAIAHRDAGTTLAASSAFRERLPSDAETDFSALLWQNLGDVAGSLADLLGGAVPEADSEEIATLAQEMGPMLVLAYGDPDRIRLVSRGGMGPLGMSFQHLLSIAGAILGSSEPESAEPAGVVAAAL